MNSCTALSIHLPATNNQKQEVMNGFLEKGEEQLFRGCISAINGYIQPIAKPRKKDCDGFPQAYWSGHYLLYGTNVQAICNSNCCFQYFVVVAPGKCPDQKAFERTQLSQIVSKLCPGQYIVGDAAYTSTDQGLCPFLEVKENHLTKMHVTISFRNYVLELR